MNSYFVFYFALWSNFVIIDFSAAAGDDRDSDSVLSHVAATFNSVSTTNNEFS